MQRSFYVLVSALTMAVAGLLVSASPLWHVDPDLVIVDADGKEYRWSVDRLIEARNREVRLGPIQGPAKLRAGKDLVKVWIPGQCRPGPDWGSSYGDPPSKVSPGAMVPLKGHERGFYTLKIGDIEVDLKVEPRVIDPTLQISARASPKGGKRGPESKLKQKISLLFQQ